MVSITTNGHITFSELPTSYPMVITEFRFAKISSPQQRQFLEQRFKLNIKRREKLDTA